MSDRNEWFKDVKSAVVMTTLETVAMIGRLVPWFLGDKGCEGE